MNLKNIGELLAFDKRGDHGPHDDADKPNRNPEGAVMRAPDFEAVYPQCQRALDGTNFYYGINADNRASFLASGSALNDTHRAFFDDMLAELKGAEPDRKTIVLGLEPPQIDAPYLFVEANQALLRRLAEQLDHYQQDAIDSGNQLRIVIRYASEMNDGKLSSNNNKNKYAGNPEAYKKSFKAVRELFRAAAPRVEFAFSPAIRRDLTEPILSQYWPGDDVVDVISCTWYVGAAADYKVAEAFFIAYVLHREMKNKPFGIDELGGCETIVQDGKAVGTKNDEMLKRMLGTLTGLEDEGIEFSYVTLFLEGKWGDDATLDWLK